MKAQTTRSKRYLAVVALTFFAFALFGNVLAQPAAMVKEKEALVNKMTPNLVMGIKSDNEGLRKSAIYMAGYYKVESLVDDLVQQLSKEKNASTRTLISLVLYRIGNKDGIDAIRQVAAKDSDMEVRRMSTAIINELDSVKSSDVFAREK